MNSYANLNFEQAVFLDKTALKAYMNPEDASYLKARSLFLDLDDLDRHFVTTNYIVFETHQWLNQHYGYTEAQFFLDTIDKAVAQGKLTVIPGCFEIEEESRKLLLDHPEYQFSLSEAVTAAAMLNYQISRILTFNPAFSLLPQLDSKIKIIPNIW